MQYPKFVKVFFVCILLMGPAVSSARKMPFIRIVEHPASKKVDILIDDSLFSSLLYADSLKKHVLYPVKAYNGITITRGYPIAPQTGDQVDHPHQIGMWFNYGDVNGADYWNNSTRIDTTGKAYGTIKLQKVKDIRNGRGEAGFTVLATWFNPGGQAVLEESSEFTFRANGKLRSILRKTTLKALTNVSFTDNKEGLFAIRVSRQLEHPSDKAVKVYSDAGTIIKSSDQTITTGKYESSTGIAAEDVFGTRSKWLKLSGYIDNRQVCLVMMDHPSNVNYPGFWMARPYGLFASNPLGAAVYTNGKEKLGFALKKDQQVVFKHQLLTGNSLTSSQIEKYYSRFEKW